MRFFVGPLLFLLAWSLSALFLHEQWQDKEKQHLAENDVVAATTYQASVATYQLATELLFAEIMQHDSVLDTFAAGVMAVGPERDRWRGTLYRLLAPTYAQLKQRGIRQLHFHTADGHSFLRFHAPHLCDDPLFDARPTIRLANSERQPVTGFEAGKMVSGFRYVHPVFRGEEHLGTVETSVTFRSIREAMTGIDPTREYTLVLRREQVEEVLFDEQRPLYETAPLHDDFLVEDPHLRLPDTAPPPSDSVRRLDRLLHEHPQVQTGMKKGEAFTVPLFTEDEDWAVSFVPVQDILGRQAAYVVAYARNPFSATLRRDFYLGLGIVTLFLGAFAWFTWGLLRSRGRLRREKRQLQIITDTIGDGLYVMNGQGVIERVNPTFGKLLGYCPDEVVGRIGHGLFHVRDDGAPFENPAECPICSAMGRGEGYVGEELFRRKDGTLLNVEISCQPIRSGDEGTGVVAAFRDISKRKESDERIRYLAEYDTLTNLPNRTLFLDRLRQAIVAAQRDGEIFAVLFLDIDLFKSINDSLGHPVGDQLLQEMGRRLVECVRASDTVSRQGGDEFIIILRQIRDAADPAQIAQKMLTAMGEPFIIDTQELRVSGSIGIALYPPDGKDEDDLIKNADAAMYHAKKLGRNNYQFFTADLNVRARKRLEMENSLRLALDRREFLLHYQPQVELESGRVIGAEALLRWQHPEQGLVPPGEFIPLAEECGLIVPIGEWVLGEVCRQNKAWQNEGLPKLPVAVNLSPIQFRQRNLEEVIHRALSESGLDPAYLEIEITESLLMSAEDQTIALLYQLKNLGLSVAIDDFGTGYSSLSYLKLFPIDKLKVDRSFVRDVSSDPDDAAITSAIIAMAHRLRLKVLAEGVETIDQRNFLILEGCNEAQGFHYSRPLPADEMRDLLRNDRPLPPMPESIDPV
jgi:diguanylate cyclase (GGDEF)-like protein/PAS domain S-box-containing protein